MAAAAALVPLRAVTASATAAPASAPAQDPGTGDPFATHLRLATSAQSATDAGDASSGSTASATSTTPAAGSLSGTPSGGTQKAPASVPSITGVPTQAVAATASKDAIQQASATGPTQLNLQALVANDGPATDTAPYSVGQDGAPMLGALPTAANAGANTSPSQKTDKGAGETTSKAASVPAVVGASAALKSATAPGASTGAQSAQISLLIQSAQASSAASQGSKSAAGAKTPPAASAPSSGQSKAATPVAASTLVLAAAALAGAPPAVVNAAQSVPTSGKDSLAINGTVTSARSTATASASLVVSGNGADDGLAGSKAQLAASAQTSASNSTTALAQASAAALAAQKPSVKTPEGKPPAAAGVQAPPQAGSASDPLRTATTSPSTTTLSHAPTTAAATAPHPSSDARIAASPAMSSPVSGAGSQGAAAAPTDGSGSAASSSIANTGPLTAALAQGPSSASTYARPMSLQLSTPNAAGAAAVPIANLGLLAFNIAAQTRNGIKKFDIALHPADLGSIQVQMTVDPSGMAQLHLQAANPQTLHLLRQDAPQLQSALKDAGINLAGNGLNFSLQGQQQQNSGGFTPRSGSSLALSAAPVVDTQTAASTNYTLSSGNGRLDIKV
ncbi:MAG: flagellar hook-length control protein FliK [Alphaproteobacteria bacterium]|nr:flagellar hook-length control protein FliK [Alphaproteobacteria bacterium]